MEGSTVGKLLHRSAICEFGSNNLYANLEKANGPDDDNHLAMIRNPRD